MKILSRLPYAVRPAELTVRGETVRVRPYQIIVWVNAGPPDFTTWDPRMPHFPAILDPGNNHNFSIGAAHLVRWAGMVPDSLPFLGAIRERGNQVPRRAASLWLHANRPGSAVLREGQAPYRLTIDDGIAVYPDTAAPPRSPLLGLRALTNSELFVGIDGASRRVDVRTARRWWWPFG